MNKTGFKALEARMVVDTNRTGGKMKHAQSADNERALIGHVISQWRRLNGVRGTIRYDTIRHDTIRYDTIRYDTLRYDTIRYDTLRYVTMIRDLILI